MRLRTVQDVEVPDMGDATEAASVSEELLDEAIEESFPASDPLSFWSGRDRRGDHPRSEALAQRER